MNGAPDNARAAIDHDLCVGFGGCRRIAPNVFRRTVAGQSEFVDDNTERDALIEEAAANCPVAAIVVRARDASAPEV